MKLKVPDYAKKYPTRFFGNKSKLLNHILALVPKDKGKVFIDCFSGTGITGWACKRQLGIKVISNDIMRYAYLKSRVYVVNNNTFLSDADIKILTATNTKISNSARKYYGHVFGQKNALFIDNWASNILKLSDPIKKDIAVLLPILCTHKHFKFAMVNFSPNGAVAGGQQLWEVDLEKEVIQYAREILPQLLCDNGEENEAYNKDAVQFVSEVKGDVFYLDWPYSSKKVCNYEDNYAFYDDLVRVLTNKAHEIINRHDNKCELPPYTDFTHRDSSLLGITQIFNRSRHIPLIILSYNTTSDIAVEEIECIAKTYGRTVATQFINYHRPIKIKASNGDTKEILMVCSNDKNFRPTFYKPEPLITKNYLRQNCIKNKSTKKGV